MRYIIIMAIGVASVLTAPVASAAPRQVQVCEVGPGNRAVPCAETPSRAAAVQQQPAAPAPAPTPAPAFNRGDRISGFTVISHPERHNLTRYDRYVQRDGHVYAVDDAGAVIAMIGLAAVLLN